MNNAASNNKINDIENFVPGQISIDDLLSMRNSDISSLPLPLDIFNQINQDSQALILGNEVYYQILNQLYILNVIL